MEQKLFDAAARLPEPGLAFEEIRPETHIPKHRRVFRAVNAAAACLALLLCAGLGAYAYAAEAREYNNAVVFFQENKLSTEGLTRSEIKAVYRDITTESFTYSKTAEVIGRSLSDSHVGGYEIWQADPAPEDVEALWQEKVNAGVQWAGSTGVHYQYHTEFADGYPYDLRCSTLEKYDGETRLWGLDFSEFCIDGYSAVSDGVIVFGNTWSFSTGRTGDVWLAKVDENGNLAWKRKLHTRFEHEYITHVLENDDGSYAVISRGDLKYLCLGQYTADCELIRFHMTEVGNYGIRNAARLGEGYLVQLFSYMTNEHAHIVKLDRQGVLTDSFSYSSEDSQYYITDMIEYNDRVYLSAYAVPLPPEDGSWGGRDEIAGILDQIFGEGFLDISSEELTPMVRDNYTAMLLVCDPSAGTPLEFYSAEGSRGYKLALGADGTLVWDVESISYTFFSPATNAFTIGGSCDVYRYTFGKAGSLLSQEETGEVTRYFQ